MIFEKQIPDIDFKNKYQGKHFNKCWYTTVIDSSCNGYHIESGGRKVLFKFKKNVIPESLQKVAVNSFLKYSKKKHSNRGMASGVDSTGNARHFTSTGQNEGNYTASNISGYFDRPLREHRGTIGSQVACRTTAFTRDNMDLWTNALPFIQRCSRLYKKMDPEHHSIQKAEWNRINPALKIPKSVFTTVTSNYNWTTACHCDSGDFEGGLGNLVVCGHGFSGGYLGFPQFKVLIKIQPGDFLLMDVHQWHCNTKIHVTSGFRLSFVMYIRSDMSRCKRLKRINGTSYYL